MATAATGTADDAFVPGAGGASTGRATGNDSVLGVAPQAGVGPEGGGAVAGVAAGGDGPEVDPLTAARSSRSSSSSSSTRLSAAEVRGVFAPRLAPLPGGGGGTGGVGSAERDGISEGTRRASVMCLSGDVGVGEGLWTPNTGDDGDASSV